MEFDLQRHHRAGAKRRDPVIHLLERWIAGSQASEATPFFERLCPAMTGG